jgi:hypothetical protein
MLEKYQPNNSVFSFALNANGCTYGITNFPADTLSQPTRNSMIAFAVSHKASETVIYWKNGTEIYRLPNSLDYQTIFNTQMNLSSSDMRYILGYGPEATNGAGGNGKLTRFILTKMIPEANIISKLNELKNEYVIS